MKIIERSDNNRYLLSSYPTASGRNTQIKTVLVEKRSLWKQKIGPCRKYLKAIFALESH